MEPPKGASSGGEGTWELETPVVLIIFNRPELTERVFRQISRVEPSELFIIADGPREDHPDDVSKCAEAREVVERVEWNCNVTRDYADENLGISDRIPSGLDEVFDEVDEAIILEDDCVPDGSFFRYCQVMLEEYRQDERIMDVTGTNHLGEWKTDTQDYHFSIYGGIWGWATWKRAWSAYDPEMKLWNDGEIRDRVRDYVADDKQFKYWKRVFQRTYEGKIETWDYQWGFARSINSGLSVVPSRNLVSNIGFGEDATHTTRRRSLFSDNRHRPLNFPIRMNDFVVPDRSYDRRYYELSNSMWEKNRLLRAVRTVYERLFEEQ